MLHSSMEEKTIYVREVATTRDQHIQQPMFPVSVDIYHTKKRFISRVWTPSPSYSLAYLERSTSVSRLPSFPDSLHEYPVLRTLISREDWI